LDHTSGTLVGGIAGCASAYEDSDTAAFLYGAAHAVSDHAGIENSEWVRRDEERFRQKTSDFEFMTAFARGHSLAPREALKVALSWSDEHAPEGPEIV
jgi:hypothetical protein